MSLLGSTISAGVGVLVTLDIIGDDSDACISNLIVSDSAGNALEPSASDCTSFAIGEEEVNGCTDSEACYYNPDANTNDGSCDYAEENFDCEGNCTAEEDCAGICGGDATDVGCGCDVPATWCLPAGLSIGSVSSYGGSDAEVEILYSSPYHEISGNQFDIAGVTVNEGSDGTLEYVKQSNFKHTFSDKNVGLCTAINSASKLSSSAD